MDSLTKIIIVGRYQESKGEICIQSFGSPDVAMGTSVGVKDKRNEDGVGAAAFGPEIILAIADGHWGWEASEIAISKAVALLDEEIGSSREAEVQAQLFSLFEQVNTELFTLARSTNATPETTLIVCHVREAESGNDMHWSSFGDSYLFLLREQHLKQLNTLYPRWLGYLSKLSENPEIRSVLVKSLWDETRYIGITGGLETGTAKLLPGDIIFLCTDGLIGSDSEPAPSILEGIKEILGSNLPLNSKVEKIIASALERGEKDNISCLVACI